MAWVYILRCGDNTFYVGHSDDPEVRLQWHRSGRGSHHTALRLPVDLVYKEPWSSTRPAAGEGRHIRVRPVRTAEQEIPFEDTGTFGKF